MNVNSVTFAARSFRPRQRANDEHIPPVDLSGASNAAWAEKNRCPEGCAEFGLGLRCSSVTAPLAGDAPSSRLAPGQIGRNKRHRIYVLDHLAVAVGRRKREAVGQVPDLAHRAVA